MIKLYHATLVSFICMLFLTWHFSEIMDNYQEERMILQKQILDLENNCNLELSNRISYKVTVTTYNPTRRQTDSTPNITADGTRIKTWKATEYRYIALSRDLLSRWGGPFEYGDYVVIEGTDGWDGVYQVRDTMNPRWTNRVDILTTNSKFKFNNVTMYKYLEDEDLVDGN